MTIKRLTLSKWGCYSISKRGVWFYTKDKQKLFVPKKTILRAVSYYGG